LILKIILGIERDEEAKMPLHEVFYKEFI